MPVVDFNPKPSQQYFIIFSIIILIGAAIVLTLPIPLWIKLIGAVIVLVHGFRVCWHYALLRSKASVTKIRYLGDNRWVIENREGTYATELDKGTSVTAVVILLHFKIPGRMFPLKSIIFRDSLSVDEFRQLLVVLRAS